MQLAKTRTGRLIGVLLLMQVVIGILLNFVFTAPLFGEPGFLINAAPHATQIAQAALIGIAMGIVSLAIASILYPLFKPYSHSLALFYFALVTAGFALSVAENISMLSMLSLSKAYALTGGAQEALYQGLRLVVKETRNWTHISTLIVAGATLFTFYLAMFRIKLIPRALAGFGMAASLLQIAALSMPLFGGTVDFRLIAPLGVCELAVAFWLIIKGFNPRNDA